MPERSRLIALAARDLLLCGFTAGLWMQTLSEQPVLAAEILAALFTVLIAYLLHEWGHLVGALLTRSVVHLPDGALSSPFLFRFDTGRNTRHQFLVMSLGGFIASVLVVLALLMLLPLERLSGRLALGLIALGVLATLVLELPVAWRVYRGSPLPEGRAFVHSE